MDNKVSAETADWWMWQMYREVAQFINCPDTATEARLKALVAEYRSYYETHHGTHRHDEHEWALDFRQG